MRELLFTWHRELRAFISALPSEFSRSEGVSAYFAERSRHELAVRQDLLPLLVFSALSKEAHTVTMPLVAAWSLHLAAAHLVDHAQDRGDLRQVHQSIAASGAANIALAQLDRDEDTLRDMMDATGRVAAMAVSAQRTEWEYGRVWSRADYFRSIAGKSAAIIATGIWLGGRLATEDAQTLTALKEFGLALGMSIQISDDLQDLAEDLVNGTYTLPVIEGLALVDHPDHPALRQLLDRQPVAAADVPAIVQLLEKMGAMTACRRVIRAYQVQAAAAFTLFPALDPYFATYVAAET